MFVTKKLKKIMSISLEKLKKRTAPDGSEKSVKKNSRFDGLSEEEVKKNTLKDILEHDLDIVFVGINPSLMAAHTGRYYAGPGNHFYKLLYESELIPEPITYEKDDALLSYSIGLTNIVERATRSSADLSKSEIKKGAMIVHDKLKKFKPKIAVFNGKCIWEEFVDKYDKSSFRFGLQPGKVGETSLWVVPSSSARCANFPRMRDKLHFYTSLKKYLAYLKGEIDQVDPEEFKFNGKCKQAIPNTSKMWRRKTLSAFASGGRIVNKETICMDTSEENVLAIPNSSEFVIKVSPKKDDNSETNSQNLLQDNSQEGSVINSCSQNDEEAGTNNVQKEKLRPKKRQSNNKIIEVKEIKRNRLTASLPKREKNTIDFVSIIKQRLNSKKTTEHKTKDESEENNENDSEKFVDHSTEIENRESNIEDSESCSNSISVKGLQFQNLKSRKALRGFKIKTLETKIID